MIRQGLDYEVVKGWGKLPKGWVYTQVAGVAVDSKDQRSSYSAGVNTPS